jgi:GNAT superfamily N-acetyltransferase
MIAEIAEIASVDELARRQREQHLTAVVGAHDPSSLVPSRPMYLGGSRIGSPVDADPHDDPPRELRDRLARSVDCAGGGREGVEERVALVAVVAREHLALRVPVAPEHLAIALRPETLEKTHRSLDVRVKTTVTVAAGCATILPGHTAVLRTGQRASRLQTTVERRVRLTAVEPVRIERLDVDAVRLHRDALAAVLRDCVEGGASVSYMWPFSHDDARSAFAAIEPEIAAGERILLAAFAGDELVGTVQLAAAWAPNQPHRGDIAKLLVRRSARNRGVGRLLMERVEIEARAFGKSLLVLDTVTGDPGERLYERLGWVKVGVIPNYALYPDGRPCDTTVFWKEPP